MANVEVVIKIPEEMYNWVNDVNKFFNDYGTSDFIDLVKNGKLLPKGHGRLVDESQITKVYMQTTEEEYINEVRVPPIIYIVGTNAPVVVEADDAESEEG